MNVERDENGRLKPGSVLNPYGNTKAKAWNKLKEKIGDDIDELYADAKTLIKSTESDSVKANLILTLLGMLKPKTEIDDDTAQTISTAAYYQSMKTIVEQEVKIKELEGKIKKSKSKRPSE